MNSTKTIRYVLIAVGALLVIAIVFRTSALQWAFKYEQRKLKTTWHLHVQAEHVGFSSWKTIQISGISIQQDSGDTLAVIQKVQCSLSLLSLFTGNPSVNALDMDSAIITLWNEEERNNISFLTHRVTTQKSGSAIHADYYQRASASKNQFLKLIHTAVNIQHLEINYRDTGRLEHLYIPQLSNDGKHISGSVINLVTSDTLILTAAIESKSAFSVSVQHLGNPTAYLPFLDKATGLQCRFASVKAKIDIHDCGDELQIIPTIVLHNFHIQHWRLAKEDVVFQQAQFTGKLSITGTGAQVDSSSTVTLNSATFKFYTAYHIDPDTTFALQIHVPQMPADTFFNALPVGMFNTLKGISCSGTLAYDLDFFINTSQPDSLIFESQLKRKNFHINHMGQENYARINQPFVYDAFSGQQFIRHITVGPENPDYTPYNHISPYLPAAIWQSEDPSFMQHRGFVAESFRESIAQNYKQRRFARGGSTITMQLVKNVFLTRNKTISRKAEEALIVYLIENLGLVPKERMMEVYLNVIEWGPNVYGVGEAARFYFNKKPADLSLQESIFLAAIIPNPRYFRYQFNQQGEIKGYMADFFKIIEGRMAMRGYLTERDTIHFTPHVKLTGPALQMVAPTDSVVPEMDESLPAQD